jgi:hypothetical protein
MGTGVDVRCAGCGYIGTAAADAFRLYRNDVDGFSLAVNRCDLCGETTCDRDPAVIARLVVAGVSVQRLRRTDT